MRARCPVCGEEFEISGDPGWIVTIHKGHPVAVLIKKDGGTLSFPLNEIVLVSDSLPLSIDRKRIESILSGHLAPCQKDLAAVQLLLRIRAALPKAIVR